jgi:hypothetical protein
MLRSAVVDQKALIFVHIPKTAGTTLNRIIDWQYDPLSIFTIDPHRIRATAARFKTLSQGRRRRFRVIRGHSPYGIHEYLPQGAIYMTMLREPVARLLSSYYFILRWPLHPLHRKFKRERLTVDHLVQFQPHRHNLQCRFISGLGNTGTCDRGTLELAKENLARSFRIIGLAERFEESLLLMTAILDWRVQFYESHKVATTRPSPDPALLEMLSERNQLDLELYEFAKKRFEQDLQKHDDLIHEIKAELSAVTTPGPVKKLVHSSLGFGRFLVSKMISAI